MKSRAQRVLLIEDNLANPYLATLLLKHEGHDVTNPVNARDGVNAAGRFAFVALDLQLPDVDGFKMVRLRSLAGIPAAA